LVGGVFLCLEILTLPNKFSTKKKILNRGKSSQQSVDVKPLLRVDVRPVDVIPLFDLFVFVYKAF
jgi:hypothetical protein